VFYLAEPRQRLTPHERLPRHRHAGAYAALVLSGGYMEAGDSGRRRVSFGEVVFHRTFEAHADHIGSSGAEVLNLPITPTHRMPPFAKIADADEIARTAEHNLAAAIDLVLLHAVPLESAMLDWPDQLAYDLREHSRIGLRDWARRNGLVPEAVSRGFRKAFGISPKRYRLEARTHAAFHRLISGSDSFAAIAADTGFADLSHLCRAVTALTGRPPSHWRADQVRSRRA
jgi:AraC-like DNA-binding protein